MPKRKFFDDDQVNANAVPLPIQTFLWRQTSPFIRPKLGKLHEATCVFCQQAPGHHEVKEACKSFEKVLVQNIQFGLSPSLTEAIKSIPRWRLVQASLPHVMHCCAALLYNRRDNIGRLGSAETKLLYTLHWILLDAAEECADNDAERGIYRGSNFQYLFPVSAIEVFVYLFAPLCFCLKESDFQSFRLENGLKLWRAMWEYRTPDVPCFTTQVKPRRTILRGRRSAKSATQFGDVFLGGSTDKLLRDDVFLGFPGPESPPTGGATQDFPPETNAADRPSSSAGAEVVKSSYGESATEHSAEDNQSHSVVTFIFDYPVDTPPEPRSSDTRRPKIERASSGHSGELCKMSSSDTSTSAHLDVSCEICHNKPGEPCSCKRLSSHDRLGALSPHRKSISPDKDFTQPALDSVFKSPRSSQASKIDISMASYLDVAVLRCLFIPQWLEEGIFWGLQYLLHRLQEIYDDTSTTEKPRRRSNSLPIPKIEVSLYQSPETKKKDVPPTPTKEPPPTPTVTSGYVAESPYLPRAHLGNDHHRRSSEKSKHKKMKMADLKAFVDSKLRSRSEKQLESIAKDDSVVSSEDQEVALLVGGQLTNTDALPRPRSALAHFTREKSDPECPFRILPPGEMVRGKSMPSLRHIEEKVPDRCKRGSKSVREKLPSRHHTIPNPIITVTEHTPTPSPDFTQKQRDSIVEDVFSRSKSGSMTRSQTDSNIKYSVEEIHEASGSIHYIAKDGGINILVVLKAIHGLTLRDAVCSLRVCEVILNLLDILLDMGLLKALDKDEHDEEDSDSEDNKRNEEKPLKKNELNAHNMFMDSLIRVFKHLGCPHGCGDGHRGPPADFLRTQGNNTLSRLLRVDTSLFRRFLKEMVVQRPLTEVMDFYHAFVGFCQDPSSLLSPLDSQIHGRKFFDGHKKAVGKMSESPSQLSYANNFGAGKGGSGARRIESKVMAATFKTLVSRLVKTLKELRNPENMGLYCDVRQLMTFTKEAHGGVFRRVALSGLLDSADRPHKKGKQTQTTKFFRRATSIEYEDQQDSPHSPTMFIVDEVGGEKTSGRKSLFRRKATVKKASSSQSIFDEREDVCPSPAPGPSPGSGLLRQQRVVAPRLSVSEDDSMSVLGTPTGLRRKVSRFQIVNWLKGERNKQDSSHEDDSGDSPIHDGSDRLYRRASTVLRAPKIHPHKSTGLQRARKRMEEFYKMGFGRNKHKPSSVEEALDISRRSSLDFDTTIKEPEVVVVKERRIVSVDAVRSGMMRFSFLMETCQPGSVPDPQLVAASLDLQAPVVARAALLLECAYFVHRCNKGQWPTWMKLNLPMFRLSGPLANRGTPSGMRRTHILQKAAGRLFYQWAEALGSRLDELLIAENLQLSDIVASITDENKRKELRIADEEEDFLDEGTLRTETTANASPGTSNCPFALKMVAVQLLLEITAFLREAYQVLPKSSRLSQRERPAWERPPNHPMNMNRRWSMGLNSQSLVSIVDQGHSGLLGERKISFVLHEADAESVNSSNTTLTMQEEINFGDEKKGRRLAQGRAHLLRRGANLTNTHSASFKRRSFKLRKASGKVKEKLEEDDPVLKRSDSIKSRRKVSAVSDRSDNSEHADISGEESPGILSDEQAPDSPIDVTESDDAAITRNMPWLKVVVQLANSCNFICSHEEFCHPKCYRRQMRACSRLVKAVRKVYGDDFGFEKHQEEIKHKLRESNGKKEKKMTRKISNQLSSGSPVKRKESFGKNMDRIDRNVDSSILGIRSRPGSMTHLARDVEQHSSDKEQDDKSEVKKHKDTPKEKLPIVKYLKTQVQNLFHSPLSLLIKGAVVMTEGIFVDIMPVAWELLLEFDQQLAGSAAVVFILSSVKAPEQAVDLMKRELQHESPTQRINAILRFQALWRFRYQAWPRMEDNAHNNFKVPPPGIDFTLPSPKIGIDSSPVIDPPWMPHFKTKVEEVTLNQDRSRTFVTATKTRKKQQMELIQTALLAEEEKRRLERENFLITSVAINMQAAYEPALYHAVEEHEEVDEDQVDPQPRVTTHHIQVAQSLFPSCLCSAAVPIINLLDDAAVGTDGTAVYQVACQAIWSCLVEDPVLFLRHFLEKLTRERQDEMIQIMRRLIRFLPKLPPQAGFTLFNYLVGYVMFYVRTPIEGGQDLIGNALSLLWMVVPSVQGILLKDLKQVLRKEQCDTTLLVTANVPSTKKIIIHGPDVATIPSQFPIHEDTQFYSILQDCLEVFGIEESQHNEWHLLDHKTNQIHNPNAYVRDYYFFKRSQYPQLTMVRLGLEESNAALQKQAFINKFVEIGKVLLMLSILRSSNQLAQRVFFLHEELQKLPSFPRKALEADFGLYSGPMGKGLLSLDVNHKLMWVRLVSRMFEGMAGSFAHSSDIHLFINVLNGALVLHCEDSAMLRLCCSSFINAAQYFKNIFASNGYLLIVPTMLRIYSSHQTNALLCHTIEFVFKQFYIMHRKPFLLQMFGSVAPILDVEVNSPIGYVNKVEAKALFKLLLTLEQPSDDPLDIMELVQGEKPLKAFDFCYQMEPDTFPLLDAISLCVTVVAYAADSLRGHQMLTILEAILPFYLKHLQMQTNKKDTVDTLRAELQAIHQISVCMKALLNNCEALAKNYTGPQSTAANFRGSGIENPSRNTYSPAFEFEEESHSKFISEHSNRKQHEKEVEDSELIRNEFRKPRDTLLNVVAEFMTKCSSRLVELYRRIGQENKAQDLLDTKCHLRLAEVAHSLLKISPYDAVTMSCKGLQRYMNEVLPNTDWSQETVRPALIMIMRRLDKTFNKIYKKPAIRRNTDWDSAASLLNGVYQTLSMHPYIAHLPHLKMLINVCESLILGDAGSQPMDDSISNMTSSTAVLNQTPPRQFSSIVVKLISMQMLALGESFSLEQVCGGTSVFPNNEKTETILLDLILPLCLRAGCGRKDIPRIRQTDVLFALQVILNALNPPTLKSSGMPQQSNKMDIRSNVSSGTEKSSTKVKYSVYQIAFLGLKILIVCFENQLASEWHRIAKCVRDLGNQYQGGLALWNFLDFVVTHRSPLFVLLLPFMQHRMLQILCNTDQDYYYQQLMKEKLQGFSLPTPKCKGTLLVDLAQEMKRLKEELANKKPDLLQSQSPSASSEPRLARRSTLHFRKRSSKRYQQDTSSVQSTATTASETQSSPQTPTSPQETPQSTDATRKPRLKRQLASTRKTFRFRSSRKGNIEVPHIEMEQSEVKAPEPPVLEEDANGAVSTHPQPPIITTSSAISPPAPTTTTTTTAADALTRPTTWEAPSHPPHRRGAVMRSPTPSPEHRSGTARPADLYMAPISHMGGSVESLTSSGENWALLRESEKTMSQSSLLMVFDSRDEDTLL